VLFEAGDGGGMAGVGWCDSLTDAPPSTLPLPSTTPSQAKDVDEMALNTIFIGLNNYNYSKAMHIGVGTDTVW
jgi:hypothetical protein